MSALRLAGASAVLALCMAQGAQAQLIPSDFFTAPIDPAAPAAVEADSLVFEAATNVIRANGDVVVNQAGYTVTGEALVYNRTTNSVRFTGPATVRDPAGNLVETTDLELTGGMKEAFLNALTITTYDGARITADSADYDAAVQTLLTNATYSPCGDCIDEEGRRIGWSMSAATITYNAEDGSVYLEQPSLALLGVPVAWLPFLWLPDTSDSALASVPRPSLSYSEELGLRAQFEVTAYSSRWTDIILTPTLMTRQGGLIGAEWVQRFDSGSFRVKASGVYQMDPGAFTFSEAQTEWRGALQTSGDFRPVKDWLVGWSYTAFTDAAYLNDYEMTDAESSVNELYATHLTEDTYIDARLQEYNSLGDVPKAAQGQQAKALPNVRFNHMVELGEDLGRVEISGRLLGVQREFDSAGPTLIDGSGNAVPYNFGYQGNKQHAAIQAGWQKQYIGAGGFVATPYLGGRADLAYYDSASALADAPGATTLWSATPIAAMDVRFPMAGSDGATVHLIEPIAQLVYRGNDTSLVGITNDDAQSFVLDDTNLFSYNRFSGYDRQETGLRANIGGRYTANFADGGYVEVVAGQSFQLAGPNAFASLDGAQTGLGQGVDDSASYAVLGAYGSFVPGLTFGGKLQMDTSDTPALTRAGLASSFTLDGYTAGLDYDYIAANEAAGVLVDQQQIGASLSVPVADYWTLRGSSYWDITASSFLSVGGGLQYDDGYLLFSADAARTGPTHTSPDATTVTASFRIRAPAGLDLGYSGAVPLGNE